MKLQQVKNVGGTFILCQNVFTWEDCLCVSEMEEVGQLNVLENDITPCRARNKIDGLKEGKTCGPI